MGLDHNPVHCFSSHTSQVQVVQDSWEARNKVHKLCSEEAAEKDARDGGTEQLHHRLAGNSLVHNLRFMNSDLRIEALHAEAFWAEVDRVGSFQAASQQRVRLVM